jgi:hypothetical protein
MKMNIDTYITTIDKVQKEIELPVYVKMDKASIYENRETYYLINEKLTYKEYEIENNLDEIKITVDNRSRWRTVKFLESIYSDINSKGNRYKLLSKEEFKKVFDKILYE